MVNGRLPLVMAKEERPNRSQLGRSPSLDYGRNLAEKSLTLDIGITAAY